MEEYILFGPPFTPFEELFRNYTLTRRPYPLSTDTKNVLRL